MLISDIYRMKNAQSFRLFRVREEIVLSQPVFPV